MPKQVQTANRAIAVPLMLHPNFAPLHYAKLRNSPERWLQYALAVQGSKYFIIGGRKEKQI
ncbi:MAG: hypothetical protein GF353_15675 [Candidatus Lokiarchaeota archaeon]|nr:hypothetical protein [Candidatus Lokiarchaeota archaeon]